MSDQTVIDPTSAQAASTTAASRAASSPAEDFANEIATLATASQTAPTATPEAVTPAPVEADPLATTAAAPVNVTQQESKVSQEVTEGVKDFAQAFSFVEQGVIKLGDAAKDELIELARKYL